MFRPLRNVVNWHRSEFGLISSCRWMNSNIDNNIYGHKTEFDTMERCFFFDWFSYSLNDVQLLVSVAEKSPQHLCHYSCSPLPSASWIFELLLDIPLIWFIQFHQRSNEFEHCHCASRSRLFILTIVFSSIVLCPSRRNSLLDGYCSSLSFRQGSFLRHRIFCLSRYGVRGKAFVNELCCSMMVIVDYRCLVASSDGSLQLDSNRWPMKSPMLFSSVDWGKIRRDLLVIFQWSMNIDQCVCVYVVGEWWFSFNNWDCSPPRSVEIVPLGILCWSLID